MRFVPKPLVGAQRCAVTGRQKDRRGFIHTGRVLTGLDPEVFVSAAAVEEMGKKIGMVAPAEVAELTARVEAWESEVQELRERLEKTETVERLTAELEAA